MTALRSDTKTRILEILRASDLPLGAYEIVARLSEGRSKVAPTTVYRALSGLINDGCAHRVESMNAYLACKRGGHGAEDARDAVFSICDDCGAVVEHPSDELLDALAALSARSGFGVTRHVIEVHGRCAECADEAGGEAKRIDAARPDDRGAPKR